MHPVVLNDESDLQDVFERLVEAVADSIGATNMRAIAQKKRRDGSQP
ncbi:hypothetical protein [Halalkaliarchaeum sp. AArc-CO]|nr:hypothetical protein [Halalkaliarchaeum sp. AArc-CO]